MNVYNDITLQLSPLTYHTGVYFGTVKKSNLYFSVCGHIPLLPLQHKRGFTVFIYRTGFLGGSSSYKRSLNLIKDRFFCG